MRIDIPPDLMTEGKPRAGRVETTKIRVRPATRRIGGGAAADASASKYDQLLQSMYDASLITDLNGRIMDGNARATEFLLYSRRELKGLTILDIVSGSDRSLLNTLCQNLQNEKFALLQAYCVRQDGSYFPAEIAVNILKFEEPLLCFFLRDVTLRRQAEEMLRTEHNAIQNAGTGIAIANVEAKLQYINPSILKLWNFETAEQLIGKDVRHLFQDSEQGEQMVQSVLVDHTSWSGELAGKKESGQEFTVQVSAGCNRDSEGEVVGMVLSFVDVSDRKRAEEATRQAERQRVMLASVGAACHHLGQPATVIMTNLELIRRMTIEFKKEDLNEILKITNEATDTLAEVLHKLNSVNEYRTVQYLDTQDSESPENVILDI